MRVLVTGYGGFLGSEITRQLIARGDQVVGLGRGEYPHLAHLPIEKKRGDIRVLQDLVEASQGIDAVIHTAAIAGVWGPWDTYHGINTLGTLNVIDACRRCSVKVLVHCSSPSVTFDGTDQSGVNESAPYPTTWLCHYPHTKALAEKAVLEAHNGFDLFTAALRPHLIWGADDPHLFPRLLDRARQKRLRIIGSGENRIDTVHVANAAFAHLCALDTLAREANLQIAGSESENPERLPSAPSKTKQSAGGRAFFITQDAPVNCWDWLRQILDVAGLTLPKGKISFPVAWQIGHGLEMLYRLGRIDREPPMTRFLAAQLAKDHYFDISAARELLGYSPQVSLEEGLKELAEAWSKR